MKPEATAPTPEVEVQDKIVVKLGLAQQCINEAYEIGTQANPLAAQLPVFQTMSAQVYGLSKMIEEVTKLRFK